jgi:hypothetical protein
MGRSSLLTTAKLPRVRETRANQVPIDQAGPALRVAVILFSMRDRCGADVRTDPRNPWPRSAKTLGERE